VVFGIKGFFEMYSQNIKCHTRHFWCFIDICYFCIVLSNTVSRVGHFPNHCFKKTPQFVGVFFFVTFDRCNQIVFVIFGWNSDSIISQSLGFISGKASASKS
jgi:hypothetical protein